MRYTLPLRRSLFASERFQCVFRSTIVYAYAGAIVRPAPSRTTGLPAAIFAGGGGSGSGAAAFGAAGGGSAADAAGAMTGVLDAAVNVTLDDGCSCFSVRQATRERPMASASRGERIRHFTM